MDAGLFIMYGFLVLFIRFELDFYEYRIKVLKPS